MFHNKRLQNATLWKATSLHVYVDVYSFYFCCFPIS